MMTNEQRLALVLEASDNATATLQRVRKEIEATGASTRKGTKDTGGLNSEFDKISDTKLVKGARAMSSIARAAEEAKLGSKEATRAMGELAETVALASGNAKLAGWAIALNAAVIAGGALVSILQQAGEAAKPSEQYLKHVQNLTDARARMEASTVQAQRTAALNAVDSDNTTSDSSFLHRMLHRTKREGDDSPMLRAAKDFGDSFGFTSAAVRNAETVVQNTDLLSDKAIELAKIEKIRLIGLGDQTREMMRQHAAESELGEVRLRSILHQATSLDLQKAEALSAKRNADQQVDAQFRSRDADGQLHKLTADELSMKGQLLGKNRENYDLAIQAADLAYKDQQESTKYSQDQTIWYATRRLAQSDYQTSLDTALHSYGDQLYALQRSGKTAEDITAETGRLTQEYLLQKALLEQMHDLQTNKLRAQNNVDAAGGGLFGPGNAGEQHQARLDQIEEERVAAIQAGEDEVEANRRAQNEIRKENRRVIDEARDNYKTIEDVLIASKSRQIKAIGHAAQTLRKLEIGAEGAYDAVLALREGGLALASFASGDFAGGALHLASAAQLGAAAALAGQEALGGGTSSGGGGGGASGAGTFEPRNAASGGPQVINLYTTNPYSRENIQQVQYELDRAGVLKIPPTTGIRVA